MYTLPWTHQPLLDIPTPWIYQQQTYPLTEKTWNQAYPAPCGQAHTDENITLPQLPLWALIIGLRPRLWVGTPSGKSRIRHWRSTSYFESILSKKNLGKSERFSFPKNSNVTACVYTCDSMINTYIYLLSMYHDYEQKNVSRVIYQTVISFRRKKPIAVIYSLLKVERDESMVLVQLGVRQ